MPNERPENGLPQLEDHVDETPPATEVEDRKSRAPGRSSSRPLMIATAVATAAIVATTPPAVKRMPESDENKQGPKTPRVPPVMVKKDKKEEARKNRDSDEPDPMGGPAPAGPGEGGATDALDTDGGVPLVEDLCGPESFDQDLSKDKIPQSNGNPCEFVADADGTTHIIGHTLLDSQGIPRDCFLTQPWAPEAAMKIRGEVYGSPNDQNKIYMKEGKLCVEMVKDAANSQTETVMLGEASLHIVTNGKVLVQYLAPEIDATTGKKMHYVSVVPVEGQSLITQEGRQEQFTLQKGDTPLKIPLDIDHPETIGCYIASSHQSDSEQQPGGALLIGAGAILLVLRRKKGKKSGRKV